MNSAGSNRQVAVADRLDSTAEALGHMLEPYADCVRFLLCAHISP